MESNRKFKFRNGHPLLSPQTGDWNLGIMSNFSEALTYAPLCVRMAFEFYKINCLLYLHRAFNF